MGDKDMGERDVLKQCIPNASVLIQGRSYHCFLVAQKPPQELLRKLGRAPLKSSTPAHLFMHVAANQSSEIAP